MRTYLLTLSFAVGLLTSCQSGETEDKVADADADADADTDTDEFENEIALSPFVDGLFESANEDTVPERTGYFPARHYFWPVAFTSLEAPEPPYEIRELSTWVLAGSYAACNYFDEEWECQEPSHCDTRVPLKLVAYVGEQTPRSFGGGDADLELPEVPIIASVEVSGGFGAPGDWDAELLTGVLDEPVLVEESGPLWIGYMQAVESGVTVACAASYFALSAERSEADLNEAVSWEQNNLFTGGGTGWNVTEPDDAEQLRPLMQVVIGY